MGLKNISNKMYMIRDINGFLVFFYNKVLIKYGKSFVLDIKK